MLIITIIIELRRTIFGKHIVGGVKLCLTFFFVKTFIS